VGPLTWILAVLAPPATVAALVLAARLRRTTAALAAASAGRAVAMEAAREGQEAALRAGRARAHFLGMVSHELRTPMMTLALQLERLTKALASREVPDHDRQILHRMGLSAKRLGEVIDSLLSYSAIQSGRMKIAQEEFDPEPVIAAIVEELKPQAEQKGLALRQVCADGDRIRTDPRLFRLILVNLTLNAIKFTQAGGVEINALWLERGFALTVRDTGPGIPESERARIFEPFEQIEPLRTRHGRGIGLGLTIVREIAAAIGATLRLDSEVGVGSAFTVVFPSGGGDAA
jgi:signal transduction histidine kinase